MSGIATGMSVPPVIVVPEFTGNIFNNSAGNLLYKEYKVEKSRSMDITNIEEPAIITVVDNTGDIKYITNKFFLQSITRPKLERFQIVETFKDSKLFFFGERTKVYNIQGQLLEAVDTEQEALLNSPPDQDVGNSPELDLVKLKQDRDQYRWSTGFQTFYNDYLRGTKLAEMGCVANLFFERCTLTGYPIQLQIIHDANVQFLVQFQMTWAIIKEDFRDNYTKQLYTPGEPKTSSDKVKLAALKKAYKDTLKNVETAQEAVTSAITLNNTNPSSTAQEKVTSTTNDLQNAKNKRDAAFKEYKEAFISQMSI